MTIRTKFRISVGLAILSSGLILVIVAWSALSLLASERQRVFALSLNSELVSLHLLTTEFALHPSLRVRQQWRLQYASLSEALADRDDEFRPALVLLREFDRRHRSLGRMFNRLVEETPVDRSGLPGQDETTRLVYTNILGQIAAMYSLSVQVLDLSELAAGKVLDQVWYAVSAVILVVIACNAYVFFQFMPKLVQPILRLRDAIETIGQGDLSHEVSGGGKDEIGEVFRAVEEMRRNLHSSNLELQHLNSVLSDAKTRLERRGVQLEAVNRELEAFAYSVSHDLRAPLRAIDGFSDALLEEYDAKLEDEGRHYIARIQAGCRRMSLLIDDLLTLSRVTRATLEHADVDLSALVESANEKQKDDSPDRQVETRVTPAVVASGDSGLLKVAIDNLIENAWKFTTYEENAKIEFGAFEKSDEKIYYVRDNGVGVDMRFAHKLFKPFQRLHHESEFPGTGIGLATVARVVHRHGGTVWAESPETKGMTIYFTLRPGAQKNGGQNGNGLASTG